MNNDEEGNVSGIIMKSNHRSNENNNQIFTPTMTAVNQKNEVSNFAIASTNFNKNHDQN